MTYELSFNKMSSIISSNQLYSSSEETLEKWEKIELLACQHDDISLLIQWVTGKSVSYFKHHTPATSCRCVFHFSRCT